jgi:uncharacterized protein with HEPN domain
MLTGALLGLMEQIGLDIMILTDEIGEPEFFASRLTRAQTFQLLGSLAQTAANLPAGARERMPQIDWAAWAALAKVLHNPTKHPLQIWVAIKELTPMTVQQLNDYKRSQPNLFSLVPTV